MNTLLYYNKPKEGQRLDHVQTQVINGDKVIVVEGHVLNDEHAEAILPRATPGGRYQVQLQKAPHVGQVSNLFGVFMLEQNRMLVRNLRALRVLRGSYL